MDQEPAVFIPLNDRTQQLNLNRPVQEGFKELPVPAAGAMTIGGGERLPGFAYRSTVAAVVGSMDDIPLPPQVPTTDVCLVQPVQEIVQALCPLLQPASLGQRAGADAPPTTAFLLAT